MTRILLSGCGGKMGHVIASCIAQRQDCEIVAGIDPSLPNCEFPVFARPADVTTPADVIIDFSHPSALEPLLQYALEHKIPLVESTTGLNDTQITAVDQAAHNIPVFRSANMSLGVNLMKELVKQASRVLGYQFDIEIVEKHHNQKIDAPSGTALMLADAAASELTPPPTYVYDRHSLREKRSAHEIGLHAVRGGTIVGEHDVIFAGHDEVLTISHSAQSKEVFAIGAINAALFIHGKSAGLYNMEQMIQQATAQ